MSRPPLAPLGPSPSSRREARVLRVPVASWCVPGPAGRPAGRALRERRGRYGAVPGGLSGLVHRGTYSGLSLSLSLASLLRLPPQQRRRRRRRPRRRWRRPWPPASQTATALGGPRSFRLFPVRLRDVVCTGGGTRSLPGRWTGRALSSSRRPPPLRRGSPALTLPGWLGRARGGVVGAAGGLARPAPPPSGPRVSAPLLSGYLAVAFRRAGLKTPGGSPFRPRGRGGGGARRDVGRPREGFPVPPHARLSLRLGGPPPAAGASRGGGRWGVSRAPSGRPWGPGPSARLARLPWRAAAGCRVRGAPCPVCVPPFRSRPCLFFFLPRVSFRFSLDGLRRSPLAVGPFSSRAGGVGEGSWCRRQHPCEVRSHTRYRYDS